MPQKSFEELISDIRQKNFSPVYFLQGDEAYFIDRLAAELEAHVLQEFERDFNQTICYGKDTSLQTIINTCKRFPMMAERQLVLVREAQDIKEIEKLISVTINGKATEVYALEEYIKKPTESTVLVICYKYKKLDGRNRLSKFIASNAELFTADALPDYKLAAWISAYCKSKGLQLSDKIAQLISEHLGNDLSKIVNEVDKLLVANNNNTQITENDVLRFIGISKEYNPFEFSDALLVKDEQKAVRIAMYFAANPRENPLVKIVPVVYMEFIRVCKMHTMSKLSQADIVKELKIHFRFVDKYRLACQRYSLPACMEIMSLLKAYDLKSKGLDSAGTPDGELLKEMTMSILYCG